MRQGPLALSRGLRNLLDDALAKRGRRRASLRAWLLVACRPMTMGSLRFGAEQAVQKCLRVQPDERVTVITDRDTAVVSDALLAVLREVTPHVTVFVMEDFGPRPDSGEGALPFPAEIGASLRGSTASIYAARGKRGELPSFRAPMIQVIEANKDLRHAHMPNVTREIMETGMSADYDVVQALSAKVHGIVSKARRIRVTSPAGTDFTATFNPSFRWIISDGAITADQWKNLPDGEVFTCAESAEGRAVIDGCLGDYFGTLGTCQSFPIVLDLEGGVCRRLACEARPELERELHQYLAQDENANRVGEFAVGTNLGLDRIIGVLLQDEKFPGVHIALGHGYPEMTGSPWHSKAHLDMVMRRVTIDVDGEAIMRDGRFLIL